MVVVGNRWGNHLKPSFRFYFSLYSQRGLSQCHKTIHIHICLAASTQKARFLMGTGCLYFVKCKTDKQNKHHWAIESKPETLKGLQQ